MRARASLALALLLLAAPRAEAADPVPSLDLRGFRAPVDPASGVWVQPAEAPDTGEWNAGLFFSYAYRSITLRDAKTGDVAQSLLKHQITADVVASIGISKRLQIGFDLPLVLYQTGDAPTPATTRAVGEYTLPAQAFGDLGMYAKITIVRPTAGDQGGFALAFDERLTVPTGDTSSFLGEGKVGSTARLLAEYRLPILGVHGALGVKLRGHHVDFACNAVGASACTSSFGEEIPFGLGVSFRPEILGIDPKGRMTWFVEMYGHVPVAPQGPFSSTAASSLFLDGAARVAVGGDVSVLAGLQTGLVNGVGSAPVRGLLSVSWAPRSHDKDGDGIGDDVDHCVDLAEDKDGFQDADGCPEGDNDGDEIPDKVDKCPNEAEDKDGYQDADGCPDPDNDQDRIPDSEDACPNAPGAPDPDPKQNGCPVHDKDGDGIPDDRDACPASKGPAHPDPRVNGCPATSDRDGDGVPDVLDACPTVKGVEAFEPTENGCPDRDPDHDTIVGDADRCPNEPETWNGFEDDDGCPDETPRKGRLLAILRTRKKGAATIELAAPIRTTAQHEVDPASLGLLHAIASELEKHPELKALVGARPSKKDPKAADARAQAVALTLRKLARRSSAVEVAGWDAVRGGSRAAESGIGVVLVGAAKIAQVQGPSRK
jgi:OmpA-OmpF porin, OOP family